MTSGDDGHRRAAAVVRQQWARAGGILAVAFVAGCDGESVVAPPPAVAAASPPSPLLSATGASEREILGVFYEATGGPEWANSGNWLTDAPLGEWHGVSVNAEGRVTGLSLGGNGLSGPIPPELGELFHVDFLDLWGNELSGPIPPELGGLANLRGVALENNRLSGPIPPELGKLTNLGFLSLEKNRLSGPIPPELGGLANLRTAVLGGNGLSGPIPPELGRLASLWHLTLEFNQLTGTVPLSFLQLSQLQVFRFRDNPGLCLPSDLIAWYEALEAGEGPVCSDAEVLRELFDATGGGGWANADGWLGEGPLGEWYGVEVDASGHVSTLDLEGNGLSGSLPSSLGSLAGLTALRIGDNALSGRLPTSLARTPLQELRYADTGLCVPDEARFRAWLDGVAQHDGTGVQCPPLSDRGILEVFYEATGGPGWTNSDGWLTDAPLDAWYGVRTDGAGRVVSLDLQWNALEGPIPGELGGLAELEALILPGNQLTGPIPPELGALTKARLVVLEQNGLSGPVPPELGAWAAVERLLLGGNRLSSLPPELGGLAELVVLSLESNELASLPEELGRLGNLRALHLHGNRLNSLPRELGGLTELVALSLESNELASLPGELGRLGNLRALYLDGNRLASIPPELGGLAELVVLSLGSNELASFPGELGGLGKLRALYLDGNRLTGLPPEVGGLKELELLDLSSNEMSGLLPAGLTGLTRLTSLSVAGNAGLAGTLPLDLTALYRLEDLHTAGTGLCAPADPALLDWLGGVTRQRVTLCGADAAAAYLTQAVQSREFPVPLVAGKPALLRVFLTADQATGAGMPPVRATFYRDGAVIHEAEIPAKSDPIPAVIDESSLSNSSNAVIPGWVLQPGLEVVIEPDPDGTLAPALGVPRRIPAVGRMAVEVHAMPVFELTLVPFLWEESPDATILETTAAMARDPDDHELLEHTRLLLPVSAMDVEAHEAVATSTNDGLAILEQTEMIRVVEGGRGHYLGVMAGPTQPDGLRGVAYDIGSWSSFSTLDSDIIAHELGHNRNLYHAPCGNAGGPDRHYPHGEGSIGAWGYDARTGDLVPPGQPDLMSYCEPQWISDYQFTNALRYRLETESGSILVAAATPPAASGPALLLWGGRDGEGDPYLRPSFFVDAPAALPQADGPYSLTGRDPGGGELFSLSFTMAEFTDTEGDHAGFSFALPVTWTEDLASITLRGPEGSAGLDRDTDDPVTILLDPATGQVRGVFDGSPTAALAPGPARDSSREFEVLFSRGIPGGANEQR